MKKVLIVYNIPYGIESEFNPQINEYAFAIKLENLEAVALSSEQVLSYAKKHFRNIAFAIFLDKDIYISNMLTIMKIPVFNSSKTILLCDDKALTYAQFVKNNIPTPKTYVLPFSYGLNILKKYPHIEDMILAHNISYPFIIKQRHGSFGNQVYLVNNSNELDILLQSIGDKDLLAQEYIKEAYGIDYRVNVVGHKAVSCVMRQNKTSFKSNIHQGGIMIPIIKMDKRLQSLAIKASKSVDASFAGVDIIKTKDNKYLVLEVNSNARTVAVSKATGIPLAKMIIEYCAKNSFLNKSKKEF
jgi:RimK family alpha-L-glutamate ligase